VHLSAIQLGARAIVDTELTSNRGIIDDQGRGKNFGFDLKVAGGAFGVELCGRQAKREYSDHAGTSTMHNQVPPLIPQAPIYRGTSG
jgi:hypothetical protein